MSTTSPESAASIASWTECAALCQVAYGRAGAALANHTRRVSPGAPGARELAPPECAGAAPSKAHAIAAAATIMTASLADTAARRPAIPSITMRLLLGRVLRRPSSSLSVRHTLLLHVEMPAP